MKVLFAVNNEKISESIIKKYQERYKEIISAKNVYYFNAIIKELQRDKSYDRVVLSEDLEPFSNKNYDMIDKFLFDKLDRISDEASNSVEGEIPIVVICTDRREKANPMLLKMFSIGIYSALIGTDRTIENVCDLINQPRAKKEAKVYYKIDSDDVDYKSENAEDVSETEIQNILTHYKKLGRDEEKFVESFYKISTQYTDTQLKLIASFLPLNVKAVLEEKCPKYQELMIGSVKGQIKAEQKNKIVARDIKLPQNNLNKIDVIENALKRPKMSNPVVIPSTVDPNKVKKIYDEPKSMEDKIRATLNNSNVQPSYSKTNYSESSHLTSNNESNDYNIEKEYNTETADIVTPVKRGRGRPPKVKVETDEPVQTVRRGRGRPRKNPIPVEEPKIEEPVIEKQITNNSVEDSVNLFDLGQETGNNNFETNNSNSQMNYSVLPGLEDTTTNNPSFENNSYTQPTNNSYEPINGTYANNTTSNYENNNWNNNQQVNNNNYAVENTQYKPSESLSSLLTSDKKIVAFVGTSKNGTSFLVNNLAALLSSKGINTAILDLTKNKNAYYIYTQNDINLRNQATNCVEGLRSGVANGIKVNNNLTVYTTLPSDDNGIDDYSSILATLAKNYSLVLMDCDFSTDYNYFASAQELYLVQSYDILTIQPLTAFLRELADRNILDPNKIRVVLNKSLRVKNLNDKMIIGGISCYNDPSMSFMKQLFNKDTAIYTTIPFEDETYAKYLEGLVTCEISLRGYSKGLVEALTKLGDMVYPLISNKSYGNTPKNYNNYDQKNKSRQFNTNINSTLDKMRKLY